MRLESNTREKIRAILAQIDQLLLSDFPHPHSADALGQLKGFFSAQQNRLERAIQTGNSRTIRQACSTVNERIHQNLPILGFILRSTNVRNSFESYHVLLECARTLIGSSAKFILSSEWDYSPLTYPLTVSALPNYVLLGLPAFESGNALILPLAGHELGHSIWQKEDLETFYAGEVEGRAQTQIQTNWSACQKAFAEVAGAQPPDAKAFATDLFLSNIVAEIAALALSQAEEVFCDAVGCALFGASYLYAFHYLLAPDLAGPRSPDYPTLVVRSQYIADHSTLDAVALGFASYSAEFSDWPSQLGSRDSLLLQMADAASDGMAEALYARAQQMISTKAAAYLPNPDA